MRAAESEIFHRYHTRRREDDSRWELGRGGMGVTDKTEDAQSRWPAARKVVSGELLGDEVFAGVSKKKRRPPPPDAIRIWRASSIWAGRADERFYSMEFIDVR